MLTVSWSSSGMTSGRMGASSIQTLEDRVDLVGFLLTGSPWPFYCCFYVFSFGWWPFTVISSSIDVDIVYKYQRNC